MIIGTPTYAIPTWFAREHPDVLAITPNGQNRYGARQNMDISNSNFRFYAERIIRKLVDHVKDHPAVIGYQVDNETKPYNTSGPEVQKLFVQYMKAKFPSLDSMNKALVLTTGATASITGMTFHPPRGRSMQSLASEFARFQRKLVTDYLVRQAAIVNEYKRSGQFITHNFDFEWRGVSYGIQPDVDHFAAAKAIDIAGCDIYHPTQDHLTGAEISLGGDIARSMKGGKNYLVIETEAQGFPQWVPHPGQLRLQAFWSSCLRRKHV